MARNGYDENGSPQRSDSSPEPQRDEPSTKIAEKSTPKNTETSASKYEPPLASPSVPDAHKRSAFTELMSARTKRYKASDPIHKYNLGNGEDKFHRGGLYDYIAAPQEFTSATVIFYDDDFVAIHDAYPKSIVHTLLLPRSRAHTNLHPFDAFKDEVFLKKCMVAAERLKLYCADLLREMIGKYSETERKRALFWQGGANSCETLVVQEDGLAPGKSIKPAQPKDLSKGKEISQGKTSKKTTGSEQEAGKAESSNIDEDERQPSTSTATIKITQAKQAPDSNALRGTIQTRTSRAPMPAAINTKNAKTALNTEGSQCSSPKSKAKIKDQDTISLKDLASATSRDGTIRSEASTEASFHTAPTIHAASSTSASSLVFPSPSLPPPARDYASSLLIGIHAHPSMHNLHIHVLSPDGAGPANKTRRHYNTIHTPFFVPLAAFAEGYLVRDTTTEAGTTADTTAAGTPKRKVVGLAPDDPRRDPDGEQPLERDLVCWRCGGNWGRKFAAFRRHLDEELRAWREE